MGSDVTDGLTRGESVRPANFGDLAAEPEPIRKPRALRAVRRVHFAGEFTSVGEFVRTVAQPGGIILRVFLPPQRHTRDLLRRSGLRQVNGIYMRLGKSAGSPGNPGKPSVDLLRRAHSLPILCEIIKLSTDRRRRDPHVITASLTFTFDQFSCARCTLSDRFILICRAVLSQYRD